MFELKRKTVELKETVGESEMASDRLSCNHLKRAQPKMRPKTLPVSPHPNLSLYHHCFFLSHGRSIVRCGGETALFEISSRLFGPYLRLVLTTYPPLAHTLIPGHNLHATTTTCILCPWIPAALLLS